MDVFATDDEEVGIDKNNRRREEKNSELRSELHIYRNIEDGNETGERRGTTKSATVDEFEQQHKDCDEPTEDAEMQCHRAPCANLDARCCQFEVRDLVAQHRRERRRLAALIRPLVKSNHHRLLGCAAALPHFQRVCVFWGVEKRRRRWQRGPARYCPEGGADAVERLICGRPLKPPGGVHPKAPAPQRKDSDGDRAKN